jgi:ubiquitin-like 1-activating enzyme E1 A
MSEQDNESSLNEAEAELYDRQLRLWGFEAQQRMQKSKILFCGVRGLFAEVIVMQYCHVCVFDYCCIS